MGVARCTHTTLQTSIGNVVVSLNPYQQLPIYTAERIRTYAGRNMYELPPHIYAIADETYRALKERRDQGVIITGESGAGAAVDCSGRE